MDARRQIHCPTCTVEFTLDVPRTWVRCPSCGHGFVVKRISRDVDAAPVAPISGPKSEPPGAHAARKKSGWLVTGPDGVVHRFDKVDDLRSAITRGDLEDPEPESAPMYVSMSEIEVAPSVSEVADVADVAEVAAVATVAASDEVLANEPSGSEIAPGVALVPLDALDRLERRSDAPPSGERDRAAVPPPGDRPVSVAPPSSAPPAVAAAELAPDDVTELAYNDDIDDVDDDAVELTSGLIEETPLLLSSQTRTPSVPPPTPIAKKKEAEAAQTPEPRKTERKTTSVFERKTPTPAAERKATPERKTATSVARSVEPETPARSWTLPLLGVAAVGVITWAYMGPSKPEPPAPAAPTETATASASNPPASADSIEPPVVIHPEVEAAVLVIPATTAISTHVTDAPPTASSTSAAGVRAMTPGGDGGGADAISQRAHASSAFRAGDFPKARLIYEQIVAKNAQDVEAWSGLGETARAQGSMADAESAYRRALGVNPRYLPALIGLADLGWDNGDRAGAQKRYADLTERFPLDMLPERVKTRAQ
jgi:DNA-directed RNA polymerase subunit RPC12/RpoP